MEHFNTLQKKESQPTDRSRWRLWCMMLLAVLIGTSGMYGQVTWETIEVTPNVLPVAGNPGKLRLITRITGDITQPRIEVSLPSYIAYEAGRLYLNSNSNAETGITFDTSESGKVKISGISSLSSGARLEVVLDIKALKGAELNPDDVVAKMQFYDDHAKLGQEVSSASIVAKIPGISVTPEKISQYYADKDVVNTYKLFFGAIDVEVNGFELRLTVDKATTLDEIKIDDGTSLDEHTRYPKEVQTSQLV